MVIATQNPVEHAGTYVLPEAQLDRFMIRLSLGYPDKETEIRMIEANINAGTDDFNIAPVASEADIINMRNEVSKVVVSRPIMGYVTDIVRDTREDEEILLGASPRAAIALVKMSQAMAYIDNRTYVLPDDVRNVSADVLTHRMIYSPALMTDTGSEYEYVKKLVDKIPVPDGLRGRK